MLKNQEAEQPFQTSSNQTPSGAPRVTPEELNAALAAIEARRQAEAAHLAGTIPIDQAVSDLHLDSAPDEIWAEVQAQRAKAAAAQEAKQREAEQQAAALTKAPSSRVTLSPLIRVQSSKPGQRPQKWRRLLAPVLVIGVLMGTGVIPHSFTPHGFSPSLLTKGHFPIAAPVLKPFSAFPDGKEVYADDDALNQISEGKSPAQITVSENAGDNRWKLIKLQGHVYLEGYIARTDALQSLQGKAFNVYNDSNSGDLHQVPTSNIRLRVDEIPVLKSGGNSDYSEVTVPNFQPDPLTTLSEGR